MEGDGLEGVSEDLLVVVDGLVVVGLVVVVVAGLVVVVVAGLVLVVVVAGLVVVVVVVVVPGLVVVVVVGLVVVVGVVLLLVRGEVTTVRVTVWGLVVTLELICREGLVFVFVTLFVPVVFELFMELFPGSVFVGVRVMSVFFSLLTRVSIGVLGVGFFVGVTVPPPERLEEPPKELPVPVVPAIFS